MSPQRPSKQKRAAQNRNERAARAARAANANAPQSISSTASATTTSSVTSGSLLSRLRGGGSRATGSAPSGSLRARGAALRPDQPVGYRAALSAVLAAAAAVVLCMVALRYPVDARGDVYTRETLTADWSMTALRSVAENTDASTDEVAATITDWAPSRSRDVVAVALWPFSLALAFPLIGAGLGFHAVRKRSSSKVVNRALYATLFGAVLTQGLLLLFLPVVLALGVAMFQVRKAETIAAAATEPGVIEVNEVDDADEPE